ncbi:MAG: hypothetical protein H0V91_08895 [Flavisolibacter sp.]|jgi:hypothetical protein|nr:hypothetical protein [Flavisolibacter sp.]
MYQYETVSTAINELRARGFSEDFNLAENCLICNSRKYDAEDFEISEVYRFEGNTDPADEAIVYGIESKDGTKGILVNGYGYSAEAMADSIAKKLNIRAI